MFCRTKRVADPIRELHRSQAAVLFMLLAGFETTLFIVTNEVSPGLKPGLARPIPVILVHLLLVVITFVDGALAKNRFPSVHFKSSFSIFLTRYVFGNGFVNIILPVRRQ